MSKVLVVDDTAVDRTLVGNLLRDAGHEACFATNGREALELWRTELPNLIVTDLFMPELNGLELLAALEAEPLAPPVIVMTSQGNEETAVMALRQGAASYVRKLRLPWDLLPEVQRVLHASRERQHQRELLSTLERQDFRFALPPNPRLIPALAGYLHDAVADHWGNPAGELLPLYVALEEALNNALFHGNLELTSHLRERNGSEYLELAEQRCLQAPYSQRKVHLWGSLTRARVRFSIRDEGPGFDVARLRSPLAPSNLNAVSGRGIFLIRAFMDEVAYSPSGNEVTMAKVRIEGQAGRALNAPASATAVGRTPVSV